MEVEIVNADICPVGLISYAAGTSYGKANVSTRRVETCCKLGHFSVLEFASFTVRIDGVSRSCTHQLVRHRLASFVELSQRYTKIDTDEDWYVIPPEVKASDRASVDYEIAMAECADRYNNLLKTGIKPEDARYVLPQSTKTSVTMRMNARELKHFLSLRLDKVAQWEIRELANRIESELMGIEGWRELIDMMSKAKKDET